LNQHWLELLKVESTIIPAGLLESLGGYLHQVNDFDAVAHCCCCTWPKLEVNRPRILEALSRNELCGAAKWLMVLGLWLKTVHHQQDGTLCIFSFVQRLQEVDSIPPQLRGALQQWLNTAKAELGLTASPTVKTLNAEQKERLQHIRGYCVIDIEMLQTQPIPNYRCQLHIQVGANNEFDENQALPIANKPAEELPPLPEAPEPALEEAIYRCPKFLPVRQQLGGWLAQVQQRLADKCADLKQNYGLETRPQYDLLVEFCLPWEHLVESVDAWEFMVEVRRRLQKLTLGQKYSVVVRSRDRIQDLYGEINQLNTSWNDGQELLEGVVTAEDWGAITPILNNLDPIKIADEAQLAADFKHYLGIGVSGPLCCTQHNEAREKLLNGVLEAGVPVVVWSREPAIANLDAQLRENLLAIDCFRDLNILIERTVDQRAMASPPQPLGYHLAVWCDEPQRIEALNELSSKARLG